MLDKAKITYHSLLKDDDSNARAFAPRETQKTDGVILSEGWALKTAKKSARFNEAQKKYLEEKFNIEQRAACSTGFAAPVGESEIHQVPNWRCQCRPM